MRTTWKPSGRKEPAGDGCLLIAREPTPGESGMLEVALRVDEATGLPETVVVDVRNARDRLGNAQDSRIEYHVTPDATVSIEVPD